MRAIPCQDGTLRVQNMIKKPMISQLSDKVTSIFTFSENLTDEVDRLSLLETLCRLLFFTLSRFATSSSIFALNHCLLKRRRFEKWKPYCVLLLSVIKNLYLLRWGISPRTVEEHIRKIKQTKLANEYLWSVLLELIRNERRNLKIE